MNVFLISLLLTPVAKMFDKSKDKKKKEKNENYQRELIKEYFKSHDEIALSDKLVIKKAQGNSIDKLDVVYNGEHVCKIGEYKSFNNDYYELLKNKIVSLTNSKLNTNFKQEEKTSYEMDNASYLENERKQLEDYIVRIKDETLNEALYKTSSMLKTIDILIKKDQGKIKNTGRLKEYYMPTLFSLLDRYIQMERGFHDKEYENSKVKLLQSINLINEALDNILDSMNDSQMMDINSEAFVLETLLKQDGLVKDDLYKAKGE